MPTESPQPLPTCRAHGVDRYHHAARADLSFGAAGWFVVLNGISGAPREITFTCSGCGEAFETTRDPSVLKEFRRYPYVDRAGTEEEGSKSQREVKRPRR